MRRIVMGLVAAIVIAAGGMIGFYLYVQHRAVQEIETALEQVRPDGGKASHGRVSYDPLKRTLTVADIAVESPTQPPTTVRIAGITASGVGEPEPGRFSADLVEATDVEIGFVIAPGSAQLQYSYKVPKVTLTDCSGPAQPPPAVAASAADRYQSAIAQFARLAVSSAAIPSLSAVVKFNSALSSGGEFSYSGITIEGVKDGKIATARVDKATVTYNTRTSGKDDGFTGTFANLTLKDFDATAAAAVLDPQKSNDDGYYRVYRQVSADAYDVTSRLGLHMRFDRFAADDVGVRPSRLQLPELIAAIPQAGTPLDPAQASEMLEKLAGLYEGIHIGNFEISGISIDTPQGPATLSAVHFNLDNGKSDFGLEGLDARTSKGPFRTGKFALKSLDLAKVMRLSGQRSPSDQALALFQVIQGAEVKNLVAPFKDTNKSVSLDSLNLDWGQFVGPIPSKAHLVAKMVTPVDTTNPALMPLIAAGIDKMAIDVDLGAAWTEESGAFVLTPATIEIGNLLKASARITLANVPRGVFSLDPVQATNEAAQIEAGTIELTLRDSGSVDLVVAQFAQAQNLSREAARRAIMASIKAGGEKIAAANPGGAVAVEAVTRFIETPGQTLVIKLTPLGKVPELQLVQLLKTDPLMALAQFRIEASTGL